MQLENLEHTICPCWLHPLFMDTFNWPQQLSQLKLSYDGPMFGNEVRSTLRQLSRLISLAICNTNSQASEMTGQVWEELIRSSMPVLRIFQFYFVYENRSPLLASSQEILESFSTPFYLFEKCWYVQGQKSHYVGYPRLGFEYFPDGFAQENFPE